MASRTMKHRKGGKCLAKGGKAKEHLYNAEGSPEAKEAEDERDEFKKGGKAHHKLKHGGHAEGKAPKARGDKRPRRAAGGHTPFSSGHEVHEPKGTSSGHESERP